MAREHERMRAGSFPSETPRDHAIEKAQPGSCLLLTGHVDCSRSRAGVPVCVGKNVLAVVMPDRDRRPIHRRVVTDGENWQRSEVLLLGRGFGPHDFGAMAVVAAVRFRPKLCAVGGGDSLSDHLSTSTSRN